MCYQKEKKMEIRINKVEGKTSRSGAKQGKILKLICPSKVKEFYLMQDDKGKKYTVWNCRGDWSKIGICRENISRYTYTTDFEITNHINH